MPSGHTSSAFSTATSLSLNFRKWYVVAPAYTYAAAVGYSRMYLGVHYPSDVLVGALLGSGTAYLTWKINKKLQNKRKNR
jgi:membrane-associated phospholipid phosphatase